LKRGFAAFESKAPDAVLLDVQLGSKDGLALARRIQEELGLRHLPVIAVTAHAMITDRERMIQAGCNACISKLIEFELLFEQLQQWFEATANLPSTR
jgi:CheY-like chemotaxis protein